MNEPERLGEILPKAMADIQRRIKLNHQAKVLSAVSGYYRNHRQDCPRGRKRANPKQVESQKGQGKLCEKR